MSATQNTAIPTTQNPATIDPAVQNLATPTTQNPDTKMPATQNSATDSSEASKQLPTAETRSTLRKLLLEPESKSRPSFMEPLSTMVTILVGKEKSKFMVHKEFLVHYSGYFRACLESKFTEAITKEIVLDHTTPTTFGSLVHWVYTQTVANLPKQDDPNPGTEKAEKCINPERWFDLWILADYLEMPRLQNAVMHRLFRRKFVYLLSDGIHKRLYDRTCEGSKLRKYWVWFCCNPESSLFKDMDMQNELPAEMMGEVILVLKERSDVLKERCDAYKESRRDLGFDSDDDSDDDNEEEEVPEPSDSDYFFV